MITSNSITYRFVPMGTVAPKPPMPGEFWVDVGSRAGNRVLDHHGGDTLAWSALQLVLDHVEQIRIELAKCTSPITIVTHQRPDLDAVSAVWLFKKIMAGDAIEAESAWLDPIVEGVGLNDQGMLVTEQPGKCWPIVMRLLLSAECARRVDADILDAGLELTERTFGILKSGHSIAEAAQQLTTPAVAQLISRAGKDYAQDRTRGLTFQVRLPIRKAGRAATPSKPRQDNSVQPAGKQWASTDAIFLDHPKSALSKELARGDSRHSPMGNGFKLMVVTYGVADINPVTPYRYRHLISTDPSSGFYLEGLGALLESREQEKENQLGIELPRGRIRIGDRKGRFGTNVESSWYDGSGHHYTIIDSPVVQIDGEDRCASCLTAQEVMDAIRCYGARS